MPDHRGDIRRIMYRTMNARMKTECEAEDEIRNSIFRLGLPFIATRVTFLPGKRRWAEAAALVNGEPLCVELLTQVR